MPIITDKKKFSFEFPYEWEGEDGQKMLFPCKYLYGTYGPTVQVFFNDGQGVELPADIFAEIGNFLVMQGILSPPQGVHPPAPPVGGGKPMAVPLLKGAAQGIMATVQRQPQTTTTNPLAPTQAFMPSGNPLAPKVDPPNPLNPPPEGEVPSLSNEEILAARAAAKAKAQGPTFRRGHIPDAYEAPMTPAARRASEAANEAES